MTTLVEFVGALNPKERKAFAKDMSLPLSVTSDAAVFMHQVERIDGLYGSVSLLDLLQRECALKGGFAAVASEASRVQNSIIADIKATDAYQHFNEQMDLSGLRKLSQSEKLYTRDNDGKAFISVDLKKANFAALRHLDPALVLGCDSYDALLAKYTESSYLHASKKIRQVIFGNLNPKRQQRLQCDLMAQVFDALVTAGVPAESVFMASADELVLADAEGRYAQVEAALAAFQHALTDAGKPPLAFNLETFSLHVVGDARHKAMFYKADANGITSLKCIPSSMVCDVICFLTDQVPESADLAFEQEQRVCYYGQSLFR